MIEGLTTIYIMYARLTKGHQLVHFSLTTYVAMQTQTKGDYSLSFPANLPFWSI